MRRILAVIHGPTYGGAHGQIARLAPALEVRGWHSVALVNAEGGAVGRLREEGVDAHALELHRFRASRDPRVLGATLAAAPREIRAIARAAGEHGATVVQNHGDLNPHAALAARRLGLPIVWALIDSRTPSALRRLTGPLVARTASVVLTTGRVLGEEYPGVAALGERHVVVYQAIDLDRFRADPGRRAAARAELGVAEGATVVGTIGNLNPQKGQELLLRAAALARAERPEIAVRVLGQRTEGHEGYAAHLHALASSLGLGGDEVFVDPGRRVPDLIGALDVLVISSEPRSEGIPTVLGEAMAAGIPCVSTDVGGIRELVRDGETGFLVPPHDPDRLAAAIVSACDPAVARPLVARAGEEISGHGVEALADRYAAAYDLAVRVHEERA